MGEKTILPFTTVKSCVILTMKYGDGMKEGKSHIHQRRIFHFSTIHTAKEHNIMNGIEQRHFWEEQLLRIALPVINALSEDKLKETMPVEQKGADRRSCTYLEAFGRTFCGMAPWLACDAPDEIKQKVIACIRNATDPDAKDFMNFCDGTQPLVDAAFLAHGLLRSQNAILPQLDASTKENLLSCLKSSRKITPYANNWILFSAMVETGIYRISGECDLLRVKYSLRQFMQWYKGDGMYGDGKDFHMDYYNSFVIVPMLVDICRVFSQEDKEIAGIYETVVRRAARYARILERNISPEGAYPITGRSLAYRFGVFQLLSQAALDGFLPAELPAPQVRCALTAVIERIMSAENNFDGDGWLRIGICGHQPGVGEGYISTGSLYLCTTVFLALGLPQTHCFWSGENRKWTSAKVFSGEDFLCDKSIDF